MGSPLALPPRPGYAFPENVEALLGHYGVKLDALDLYLDEDGSLPCHPETLAMYVGQQMALRGVRIDDLIEVVAFVAVQAVGRPRTA